MSTPRLTFLYPAFCRTVLQSERSAQRARARFDALQPQRAAAAFSTGRRRAVEARPNQRYGTANEPPPHLAPQQKPSMAVEVKDEKPEDRPRSQSQGSKDRSAGPGPRTRDAPQKPQAMDAMKEYPEDQGEAPAEGPYVPPSNPMDTVLHMPSPAESAAEEKSKRSPYLQPPPYVHHFDTYTMVGNLEKGGFKHEQAVELMKAMRLILTENLDVARDGLVSKSDVENETYLFRAACSELRTEIQNNRKAEMEKQRAQRTQLQHEVDLLSQRMAQMLQAMQDDKKGAFDDRRMNVKVEQQALSNKIRDIHNKIDSRLVSDSRADIEALKGLAIWRAALTLAIVVAMIVGTLKYYSEMTQLHAEEAKKMALVQAEGEAASKPLGTSGHGLAGGAVAGASKVAGGDEEGLLVSESGGRGYVSLG